MNENQIFLDRIDRIYGIIFSSNPVDPVPVVYSWDP
jgi:hypothetical protein